MVGCSNESNHYLCHRFREQNRSIMTLCEFERMDLCSRLDLLQEEGLYIGKRKWNNLPVLLYQVEAFYIELYYSEYRLNLIEVRCFTSTILLEPYLEDILIEDLVL